MPRSYGQLHYAACREHGGDALDVFATLKFMVEIRRVNDPLYQCHCGKPAEFYLLNIVEEME